MNEEKILLSLIRKDCELNGYTDETRIARMASLMNIHPERYQKVLETLIETKQINKKGKNFFVV
ncbi:MAG: hypothetical protein QXJ06_04710 [Candidatus Aenigmatarchaeota archaeon]|nr:hypothetical protein [Candidatus Aenigmarchaeota archaeon]MBU5689476.1 hypothetical protein [Candidatus Aenigmarchaeota archaeon]